jgi:hypothetical protein
MSNLNHIDWMISCTNIWLMHMSKLFPILCIFFWCNLRFSHLHDYANEVGPNHKSPSSPPSNDQLSQKSLILTRGRFDQHNPHLAPLLPHIDVGFVPLIFLKPHCKGVNLQPPIFTIFKGIKPREQGHLITQRTNYLHLLTLLLFKLWVRSHAKRKRRG